VAHQDPSATAKCPQVPAPSQTSLVQALPSLAHAVPLAAFDHCEVLVPGWHTWQPFAGLVSPVA
jgi:hypothetical protein